MSEYLPVTIQLTMVCVVIVLFWIGLNTRDNHAYDKEARKCLAFLREDSAWSIESFETNPYKQWSELVYNLNRGWSLKKDINGVWVTKDVSETWDKAGRIYSTPDELRQITEKVHTFMAIKLLEGWRKGTRYVHPPHFASHIKRAGLTLESLGTSESEIKQFQEDQERRLQLSMVEPVVIGIVYEAVCPRCEEVDTITFNQPLCGEPSVRCPKCRAEYMLCLS